MVDFSKYSSFPFWLSPRVAADQLISSRTEKVRVLKLAKYSHRTKSTELRATFFRIIFRKTAGGFLCSHTPSRARPDNTGALWSPRRSPPAASRPSERLPVASLPSLCRRRRALRPYTTAGEYYLCLG